MNNDFWVTRVAICQLFALVTSCLVKIFGKSPHSRLKNRFYGNSCIILYICHLRVVLSSESLSALIGSLRTLRLAVACVITEFTFNKVSTGQIQQVINSLKLCGTYIWQWLGLKLFATRSVPRQLPTCCENNSYKHQGSLDQIATMFHPRNCVWWWHMDVKLQPCTRPGWKREINNAWYT